MNPATPGPLTVLLVPPPGDTALLADECGGMVPTRAAYRCGVHGLVWCPSFAPTHECHDLLGGDCCEPAHREFEALLLVHEGVPTVMGIDRAARVLTQRSILDAASGIGKILPFGVLNFYRTERAANALRDWGVLDLCDAWATKGARVVLLRDGREVAK